MTVKKGPWPPTGGQVPDEKLFTNEPVGYPPPRMPRVQPLPPQPKEHHHTLKIEVSAGMWWLLLVFLLMVIVVTERSYR